MSVDTSRSVGKLSTVPNYDDVDYMDRSAEIHWNLSKGEVRKAVEQLLSENMQRPAAPAPLWLAQGLVAFTVFGRTAESVYYSLGIVVFVFLLCVGYTARLLPIPLWIATVSSALALPFASFAAFEFRPDLLWATVIGFCGVVWLASERCFEKFKYSAAYGAAIGLLLLIKPSAFMMTLSLMLGCWVLSALRDWVTRRADLAKLSVSAGLVAAIAFAVCGWFWLPRYKDIIWYFVSNVYGVNKEVWTYRGDLIDRMAYFWHGKAVACNTGAFWWPFLLIFVAGSVRDAVAGASTYLRIRGWCFLWMFVCLGLVHSIFETKTVFVGGALYSFIIFGAIFYFSLGFLALTRLPLQGLKAQIIAAVVLAAVAWRAHSLPPYSLANPEIASNRNIANREALCDLQRAAKHGDRILVVVAEPVNPDYIRMELRSQDLTVEMLSGALCRTLQEVKVLLQDSDFVFIQDPKIVGETGDAFPAKLLQTDTKAFLDSSPEWQRVNAYHLSRGKNIYFYRRVSNGPGDAVAPQVP